MASLERCLRVRVRVRDRVKGHLLRLLHHEARSELHVHGAHLVRALAAAAAARRVARERVLAPGEG